MTTMELYHNLDDEAPAPRLVRQQWESGSVLEEDGGDEGVWAGLVLEGQLLEQEQELHSPEQQLQVQGDMMDIDVGRIGGLLYTSEIHDCYFIPINNSAPHNSIFPFILRLHPIQDVATSPRRPDHTPSYRVVESNEPSPASHPAPLTNPNQHTTYHDSRYILTRYAL
ncbi:hypothetical protein N7489_000733 [Penicillium chrysogenum]|uniref:Uncharacterized protein n=1 Tax=Penicillium chrysogenum TaxID=5076 RepID=A0ABQ8WGM7_PENCH|nr:uncharacterized protein N7489_000733 [Penicillium chrysogenum]KAJ5250323.1 hypothetical protein N7489_000733 [Penicillium chrysogenum]KAJ5269227.1 hypothetical protein N7505_004985 [Penicillium chrysogenum]